MVQSQELLGQSVPGSSVVPSANFDSEYFVVLLVCNYITVMTFDLIRFIRFYFYSYKLLPNLFSVLLLCTFPYIHIYFQYELFVSNLVIVHGKKYSFNFF